MSSNESLWRAAYSSSMFSKPNRRGYGMAGKKLLRDSMRKAMQARRGRSGGIESFYGDRFQSNALDTGPAQRPPMDHEGRLLGLSQGYCDAYPEYCGSAVPPTPHPPSVDTGGTLLMLLDHRRDLCYLLMGIAAFEAVLLVLLLTRSRSSS
jgi:hypothetical protein